MAIERRLLYNLDNSALHSRRNSVDIDFFTCVLRLYNRKLSFRVIFEDTNSTHAGRNGLKFVWFLSVWTKADYVSAYTKGGSEKIA